MTKLNNTGKYECLYPNCHKRYNKTDGLRKHAKKQHPEWILEKKPKDYGYYIPKEYNGTDYVTDYMTMVKYVLAELDNGNNLPGEVLNPPGGGLNPPGGVLNPPGGVLNPPGGVLNPVELPNSFLADLNNNVSLKLSADNSLSGDDELLRLLRFQI